MCWCCVVMEGGKAGSDAGGVWLCMCVDALPDMCMYACGSWVCQAILPLRADTSCNAPTRTHRCKTLQSTRARCGPWAAGQTRATSALSRCVLPTCIPCPCAPCAAARVCCLLHLPCALTPHVRACTCHVLMVCPPIACCPTAPKRACFHSNTPIFRTHTDRHTHARTRRHARTHTYVHTHTHTRAHTRAHKHTASCHVLTLATLQVCLRYFPGAPMALKSVSFQIYDREKVGTPFGRGLCCAEESQTH